mgnify:CR=1 FL=1
MKEEGKIYILNYVFDYYGFYYPALNNCLEKRNDISNRKSKAFRVNNQKEVDYYQGQLDLIDSLIEDWHKVKNKRAWITK